MANHLREMRAPFKAAEEKKLSSNQNRLCKQLCRKTTQAISDYKMIEPGDKVMVCMSGGKDSYALLDILMRLQRRAPFHFELVAVNLNQKLPGFPEELLPNYLQGVGVPFHIETQDTFAIVRQVIPEGKPICGLCSRLRRGILYRVADELGATKIALGHHRDDILETFFLNFFFGARLKGMPPKLMSDDGQHVVIRPLAYIDEQSIKRWAKIQDYPLTPDGLCDAQEGVQRKQIKQMLRAWEKESPNRLTNMFNALSTVIPSHLMDRTLFPFEKVKATGIPKERPAGKEKQEVEVTVHGWRKDAILSADEDDGGAL